MANEPLMVTIKTDNTKTKTLVEDWEVELCGEILNHALHSGGCSTCPQIYPAHGGSNDIVVTALSGQQIIINNLNNDYNDSVFSKVKTYHCMDKP